MGYFRKKPVVIEAFRIGVDVRPEWFQDKVVRNEIKLYTVTRSPGLFDYDRTYCDIQTLEGTMRGEHGDYIIKGVKGEIYPCKPDIFEATYENVEGETESSS